MTRMPGNPLARALDLGSVTSSIGVDGSTWAPSSGHTFIRILAAPVEVVVTQAWIRHGAFALNPPPTVTSFPTAVAVEPFWRVTPIVIGLDPPLAALTLTTMRYSCD